ncbi:hypothetical protein C9374_013297 [Naegleria lovaniensis]|uniref:Uncharacterized protein n=1 Tax=Naegleria lovaniensis TaxID=51637 RepID=A0AA88H1S1_NAELO|nr:uncharacterized protein C9374_013297 [Naegleria lovaniensis]KAG2391812.1 hypothetical protein C9374_013297 [Naegleria lovaniensis]
MMTSMRNAGYDSPSKPKINILEALMSHGGDGSSSSSNSTTPLPIKTQVSAALNTDLLSPPNSPKKDFERRRKKTLAPSLPTFQKNEELNTLLTTINKTNDISITLDDSKQIVKIDNDVYVKMEYANAQVEDLMQQFSKAKQEFKESTQRLQMEYEKMDKEKMEQIAAFIEDFNFKYSSMQKRYQDALSKKYKDKIEELAQKVENYSKERDDLKSKIEHETNKFYEDLKDILTHYHTHIDGIRQKCEKEYAVSVQTCQKNFEHDLKKATEKFTAQEKEYFAKYAIHKKLFFGLLTYLREVTDLKAKLEVELKKQTTKLEIVNKKARKTENDLLNQISDLHKSIEQGKKVLTSKSVNTDLTSQEMDKQDRLHLTNVQERNCKIEALQEELSKCKLEIVSYRTEIDASKEQYQQCERTLTELRKQLEAQSATEMKLQKILQEEKEKREKTQSLLDEAPTREQISNLSRTLEEREDEISQLKAFIIERDQKITTLDTKLEQLRLNTTMNAPITKEALEMVEAIKNKAHATNQEKDRLAEENSRLVIQLEQAKIELEKQAKELVDIQFGQKERERDYERLKQIHKEELEKIEQEVQQKNEQFQRATEELKCKTKEQSHKISTLQEELEQQLNVVRSIEQRNTDLENKIVLLSISLSQSKEAEEKSKEQLQACNTDLQNMLVHFEVERQSFAQERQELSLQNLKLTETLEEKEKKIRLLQDELASQTSLTEKTVDMNDLSQIQKLFSNLSRQIRTLKAEADLRDTVYKEDCMQLKEKSAQLEKEISLWKEKYQTLLANSHFSNFDGNNTSLLEENTKLSIENKKLLYANRTLIAKVAGYASSSKWEELYREEQQKTEKLLEQCKNFVLKISKLEDENSNLKKGSRNL